MLNLFTDPRPRYIRSPCLAQANDHASKQRSHRGRRFGALHSSSAMKLGSSPWQMYSSQTDAVSQPLLNRRMSSVKVDPEDPMNTLDIAQIVLSNMASTYSNKSAQEWNFGSGVQKFAQKYGFHKIGFKPGGLTHWGQPYPSNWNIFMRLYLFRPTFKKQ